ncbi:uncharacterized protein BO95DRAFT_466141 [Aspergillus brunneoviolaceus CBS 621.78]|uniref:Uncharacterized protein n=1 Tax=Aspergillus brunneoviolaceus CBS 621.78 TaxID=1450534 RepID=A0ACD1G1N6_9EURO|nr:hypothetical protein BO95DRAFT_466141 [Aspergillus brunneoviolaceus CBS 621.78]RAH43150.1 hypothetical protein BO95DRAFT_466141 [Aspergillus brunneoviolaceus CBS 621.78]
MPKACDEKAPVAALRNVQILISLVGHSAIDCQYDLIRAIPKTKIQLFVPSNLAVHYRRQGLGTEPISAKIKVGEAAERLGVPTAVVLTGNVAEFALDTPLSELTPTGDKIAQALDQRFGATSAKHTGSIEEVTRRVNAMIEANDPLALAWYTRKNCGNGDQLKFLGSNMSEVEGYETESIEDLLVAENSESIGLGRKRLREALY